MTPTGPRGRGRVRLPAGGRAARKVTRLRTPAARPPWTCAPGLLAAALSIGCAPKKPPDSLERPAVQSIDIDGNGFMAGLSGQGDFVLRGVMETKQSPRMAGLISPKKRRTYLDKDTLELDAWRLETWYAHQGYFDAKVEGWDLHIVDDGKASFLRDPPPKVRIVGVVVPGAPTVVREVKLSGLDRLGGPLLSSIRQMLPVQVDETFVSDDLSAAEDIIRDQLQERGYAFAKVSARAQVSADDHVVDVLIEGELGPPCKFGAVTISFLGSKAQVQVPEALIRAEVAVEEGRPYRVSDINNTQRRLFGLGVFSVVNVIPMLDQAEGDRVPVRVELSRSKYRQLRTGVGVLLESGKQDVHVSADFQHVNLFNRLLRLDFENRVGYTTLVQIDQVADDGLDELLSTSGPTVMSALSLSLPHWPTRAWRLGNTFSFELGVEQGYRFATPQWSPSVTGAINDHLSVSASYQLQLFQYLDLALAESEFRRTPLGLDFRERYLLTSLRQQLTYDARDDLFVPTRGSYGVFEVTEAGRWLGGDFNFVRLKGDQRYYLSLRRFLPDSLRGTFAMRLLGGLIQPYGVEQYATVPYAERLYLGGSSDVRGWVRNHLGPYICDPDTGVTCISSIGVEQPNAAILPIGGLLSAAASAEARIYAGDYGGVAFFDVGNAWTALSQVVDADRAGLPVALLPSVGLGARYLSPIGAVRLDFAYRLDREPMFSLEPRLGVHFSLSEAF